MPRVLIAAMLALSMIGGCKMSESMAPVPAKTDTLPLPSGVDASRLFDCAQTSIDAFGKANSDWLPVARKDIAAGVLESRDFAPANISGFRVRIVLPAGSNTATIELKGAGPYFMDLGVEQAMRDLKSSIGHCLGG